MSLATAILIANSGSRLHMLHYRNLYINSPDDFLGAPSCIFLFGHKQMHEQSVQRLQYEE